MKPKQPKQPKQPSAGMTPAVRAAIAKGAKDAAIVDALKPKFPPLTARIVAEIPARMRKAAPKVRVVKKLPASAAAQQQWRSVA